ncbi:MAG: DUF885 domain-containing protein [Actinomycetes bacterium]
MTTSQPSRAKSAIDAIADSYVDAYCALDPFTATVLGVAGHDDEVTDFSPEAVDARAALARRLLADVEAETPADDVDEVTVAALRERVGVELEIHDAGLSYGPVNVIASQAQTMRDVFDLMPTSTPEDWARIARRMSLLGTSVESYEAGLRKAVADGHPPARRQVEAVVAQVEQLSSPGSGFFANLATGARPHGGEPSAALVSDLQAGAAAASTAYARLGSFLRDEIAPSARAEDAAGRDVYQLWSRYFLGATVDLEETYAWGIEELARIENEMREVANFVVPGGSIEDAVAALDANPGVNIEGKEAFRDWMQEVADNAVATLTDSEFDIPEQVRRIDCKIAPTNTGGIYYTGPSEDFSRPGSMWWAVPDGVTRFGTWRETTTVYHEGVPGHHLQIGQTMYRSELLNRWRRMMCWVSGHGEGWALYAERLMADLGFLDNPADRLGMLDGSAFRAMRVVGDIGTHCGFEAPAELGGGTWDADKLWRWMTAHTRQQEEFLRFEHLRYLGWPGQAPSYKVGERLWLQIRAAVEQREGKAFDLKTFHRRALDVGSLGLETLRLTLLG